MKRTFKGTTHKFNAKHFVNDSINMEAGEGLTEFGEFVCTYHNWLSSDDQKENAKKLENVTNKN